ncbi:hypothetical protein [Horticoccus sp. 23ND18S-11]|uniref:hypothetical protein n=1 Tax=Horticoccus sp. 23ND18S-11 TaxID=3391832 RepID=UPI0039C9646B
MNLTRTFQGLEATLKSSGVGRFGGAAFLSVWLTFWVAGEAVVAWILIRGAWSLMTGEPPGVGRAPLETAPALAVGLFMLTWLAFWTLGGVLAGRELLSLLFGRDRFVVRPDALEIEYHFGLFRTLKSFRRDHVRRFYRVPARDILSVDTTRGTVELTRRGTGGDLERLAAALNEAFSIGPLAPDAGALPGEWWELVSPEGDSLVLKSPAVRARVAMVVWMIFLPLALVAGYILNASLAQSSLRSLGAIVGVVAGLVGFGAYRLTYYRSEWVLGPGALTLQQRAHGRVRRQFEATALQLIEERDSEGDHWYRLYAVTTLSAGAVSPAEARKRGREIMSRIGDPTEARNFAHWLVPRCALSFHDGTTETAKAGETARLTQQLAQSGRMGRWLAERLQRNATKRK